MRKRRHALALFLISAIGSFAMGGGASIGAGPALAAPTEIQSDLRLTGGLTVAGPATFARDAHFIGPLKSDGAADLSGVKLDHGRISATALAVDGNATCKVLTILGGMDVAEPVPVAADNLAGIAPGMVLSIDPEHPGSLMLSSEPYDPKVAGVVSGANGIAPGLQLHTENPDASPHLLAIAGRIYVRATADNGPIAPGDRLTTSRILGVAMKAADAQRASGATIGKAMTALEAGEGWVLMLVQPQ